MRFVPVKSAERQAALLDHVAPKVRLRRNARDFLVRQRTQTVNAIRAHLAEFGPRGPWLGRNPPPEGFVRACPHPSPSVVAKGIHNLDRLIAAAQDVPAAARPALDLMAGQLRDLSEALREDGALTEYALERHITIATPTTLMMALRTVSHVWAVERRNRNAEEIAKRAGLLYDKVAGFISSMETVGTRLRQAQDSYDVAIGQLSQGSGNLLRQAEMLKTLGAKATKTIDMEFDEADRLPPPETPHALGADAAE